MNSLDDLPQRGDTHDTAKLAEAAFRSAVESCKLFVVQREDRTDYGTDVQLEARAGEAMTNVRIHVQLKGTSGQTNAAGSVSVTVARRNLNYLLSAPISLYACYHIPSGRLLARYAEDVYREYEHRGSNWTRQESITVRFSEAFDPQFQTRLKAQALASSRDSRDRRLTWLVTPPEEFPAAVQHTPVSIEVPPDPDQAKAVLNGLYANGQDLVISGAFSKFAAVLGQSPGAMDCAYMAEVNLGLNRLPCNTERIRESVAVFRSAITRGEIHPGSLLYCEGNALLALGDYLEAKARFQEALALLDSPELSDLAAQCLKNLGSAFEAMGEADEACACYRRALELDPDLGDAHFALALRYCRDENKPTLALEHLDRVIRRRDSALQTSAVQGWRIGALFQAGDVHGAFREVNVLLGEAAGEHWVWPWCARHVAQFGRTTGEAAQKALRFWRAYLREHPSHSAAERERLLCLWLVRSQDGPSETDYESFKQAALRLIENDDSDVAFLWDRIGHWAQYDGNWQEAEVAYRKAFEVQPECYGYCFGTALNFLSRFDEALPVLLEQAERYQPDAMSWFQVAVSQAGLGNVADSISAYQHALELDENYDQAWFNLGGAYWNSGDIERAAQTWREATRRFPGHELTKKLFRDLPVLFERGL